MMKMDEFMKDKRVLFLGGLCIATGVAIGLILAPLTHGIRISMWSNNAFGSGRNSATLVDGHSQHKPMTNKNSSASAKEKVLKQKASGADRKKCGCSKKHR